MLHFNYQLSFADREKAPLRRSFFESIEANAKAVCQTNLKFKSSSPLEPVLELVPARTEFSGLQNRVENPTSMHQRPVTVSHSGDASNHVRGLPHETNLTGNRSFSSSTDSPSSTANPLTPSAPPSRIYAATFVESREQYYKIFLLKLKEFQN